MTLLKELVESTVKRKGDSVFFPCPTGALSKRPMQGVLDSLGRYSFVSLILPLIRIQTVVSYMLTCSFLSGRSTNNFGLL